MKRAPTTAKSLPEINERIPYQTLQVINAEGENLGLISKSEALVHSRAANLDLVVISDVGGMNAPVAKIIDYGKFLYEKKKKQHEAKKKQHVIQIKEIKLRPKIAEHDYKTKLNQMIKFLDEGKKVKCTVVFRGREITLKQVQGAALFEKIESMLNEHDFGKRKPIVESDSSAGGLWSKIYTLKVA